MDGFSREEVRAGFSARRARTLLFLVERQAVRRAALLREAGAEHATGEALDRLDAQDVTAFALGRERGERPSAVELELTADAWAPLVPDNPRLRAAVAALLAERGRLPASIPRTRAALGLDDPVVRESFRAQTGRSLEEALLAPPGLRDRLRFAVAAPAAWVERGPVRLVAAVLTFALGVGQPLLAMPLALAACGPVLGLALVAAMGAVSALAAAATAEACVRSADVRHRGAFFGRLVTRLLGARAGALPTALSGVRAALSLLAAVVGLATQLAAETPVPAVAWAVPCAALAIWTVLRGRSTGSLGVLLLAGVGVSVLLLGLAAWAVVAAPDPGTTTGAGGAVGGVAGVAAILGVALMTLTNPVHTVAYAQLLLPRDPGGMRFTQGVALGAIVTTVFASLFGGTLVLALGTDVLEAERSTALVPLGSALGPGAVVLGVVAVGLLAGLTLARNAAALGDLARDALPRPARPAVLALRGVRAELRPRRGGAAVPVAFTGLVEDRARLRLGGAVVEAAAGGEVVVPGTSTALVLGDVTADHVEVLARGPDRLAVAPATVAGGASVDALLDEAQDREAALWLARHGRVTAAQAAAALGVGEAEAKAVLDRLVSARRARRDDDVFVAVHGRRRARTVPAQLDDADGVGRDRHSRRPRGRGPAGRLRAVGPRTRSALAALPSAAVCAAALILLAADAVSFREPIEVAGIVTGFTAAGVLPTLLAASARRRGELEPDPGSLLAAVPRAQLVSAFACAAVLLAHGFVLWDGIGQRAIALVASAALVGVVLVARRDGAFAPRPALELLVGGDGRLSFALRGEGADLRDGAGAEVSREGVVPASGLVLSGTGRGGGLVWTTGLSGPAARTQLRLRPGGEAPVSLAGDGGEIAVLPDASSGGWSIEVHPARAQSPAPAPRRRSSSPLDRL